MCAYTTFPISQQTDVIFPLLFCSSTIICVLVMIPFKPEFNGEFKVVVRQGATILRNHLNLLMQITLHVIYFPRSLLFTPLSHICHDPSRPRITLRLLVLFDCVL